MAAQVSVWDRALFCVWVVIASSACVPWGRGARSRASSVEWHRPELGLRKAFKWNWHRICSADRILEVYVCKVPSHPKSRGFAWEMQAPNWYVVAIVTPLWERCVGWSQLLAAVPTVVPTLATIFNSTGWVQKLSAFGGCFLPTKLHM